jgi:hypothetical protein
VPAYLQSLFKRRLLPCLHEAVGGPREDSLCHLACGNVYHLPIRTYGAYYQGHIGRIGSITGCRVWKESRVGVE